ncbi:Histone-lysine N-methyltransferase SETMAR [Habropoda laboriosa]|uniref:Histone-lysine N-methyltransferase SETMAR n=1 Tax=Habropoda laboriosa TaxID=597456 RepID=A0A0L7QZX4_9HYME|nr:Histone-lysine N-methyltransferase SETMAR [Habropoda laboriosa]
MDRKQIRIIFSCECELGYKAVETTCNVDNDQLKALVQVDLRTTVRQLAQEVGVRHSTVIGHLRQLEKSKKLDKWVPHELSEMIMSKKHDPFLQRTVIYDEKWIMYDNRRRIAKLNPALVNRRSSIILHENARPHAAQTTLQKLNKLGYETLPSLDHTRHKQHYKIKHLGHYLPGEIFTNQAVAEDAYKEFINSRTLEFCTTGIEKLISRWQKCVNSNGSYFD